MFHEILNSEVTVSDSHQLEKNGKQKIMTESKKKLDIGLASFDY